jgi:cell wall-associated NlpC family hydrolase
LNNLKKIWYLFAFAVFIVVGFVSVSSAQERDRVVKTISSRPLNQPPNQTPAVKPTIVSPSSESRPLNARPPLIQNIEVARPANQESFVKKTVSSNALGNAIASSKMVYSASTTSMMQRAIFARLGIPYLYGSTGPNRYDCSGFVWAVFKDAGMTFTRQSARSLWSMSEPVTGDDRYKFGTLVFLNGLGHMGIVADENGFYHASSSKGITYSPFKGYWEKRIVGFRRLMGPEVQLPATVTK